MIIFKKYLFTPHRVQNPLRGLKLMGYCCLLFLFTTCKKEITIKENSNSTIKYFTSELNETVYSVNKTADGGFIYCGLTGGDSLNTDAFLLKIDANGNKQWYKTFGGDFYERFNHVIQTKDGGFLAVGMTTRSGNYYYDYAVKTNANGDQVWSNSLINNSSELTYALETSANEFLITGRYYYNNYSRIFRMKLDQVGNIISSNYTVNLSIIPPNLVVQNFGNAYGYFVTTAEDGSMLIAGSMSKSTMAGEFLTMVPFILKSDVNTLSSTLLIPYYNYSLLTSTIKLLVLKDGYLLGMGIQTANRQFKILLMKTDFSGSIIWTKEYSGLGNALFANLEMGSDGNFLIIGSSSSMPYNDLFPGWFSYRKIMLTKVDGTGNEMWTQHIGSEKNGSAALCVQPLADGGWNVAGYSWQNETGYPKMFWMKADKDGKLVK